MIKIEIILLASIIGLYSCGVNKKIVSPSNQFDYKVKDETNQKLISKDSSSNSLRSKYLFPFRSNGKWGYINELGNIVIEAQYDEAYQFSEGLSVVSKDGKYGYIRNDGNFKIDPTYDHALAFHNGIAGVAILNSNNIYKYGFINSDGILLTPLKYDNINEFIKRDIVKCEWEDSIALVNKKGIQIYKDKKDKIVKPQIGEVYQDELIAVRKNGKYGFINYEGVFVIQPIYEDVIDYSESVAATSMKGKYGFIDKFGNVVIAPRYDNAFKFTEGLCVVQSKGKYGVISKKGTVVIPFNYDNISIFKNGFSSFIINDKSGLFNKSGKIVIEPKYIEVGTPDKYGIATYQIAPKICGYIDTLGNHLFNRIFEYVSEFDNEGYAMVKENSKYGFINRKGENVVPPNYDGIERLDNGFFVVLLNGTLANLYYSKEPNVRLGYINEQGIEFWTPR